MKTREQYITDLESGFINHMEIFEFILGDKYNEKHRDYLQNLVSSYGYLSAATFVVETVYPNARYGIDYSNLYKDKKGEPLPARSWVRYKGVDWIVGHSCDSARALLIALLKVMRDLEIMEKHNEVNVSNKGESV